MSSLTARLSLPYLASAQAQKHVTVNNALRRLDALVQASALLRAIVAQPSQPTEGDIYIIGAAHSGADWSGFAEGDIAYFRDGVWESLTPAAGWRIGVAEEAVEILFDGAAWRASAPAPGPSPLLNGAFRVWQRGSVFVNPSASGISAYTADRWAFVEDALASTTISKVASGLAWPEHALRQQRTANSSNISQRHLVQALESAVSRPLAGQPLTFAFRLRKGVVFSGGSVLVEIIAGRGTDESAAALAAGNWSGHHLIAAASFAPGAAFDKRDYVSGVAPADATQIGVRLSLTPSGTAGADDYFDIADTTLQIGADPSREPVRSMAEELAACRRYFEKWGFADGAVLGDGVADGQLFVHAFTTTLARNTIPFLSSKRIAPQIILFRGFAAGAEAGRWNYFRSAGAWTPADSTTVPIATTDNVVIQITAASLAFGASHLINGGWTADSEL